MTSKQQFEIVTEGRRPPYMLTKYNPGKTILRDTAPFAVQPGRVSYIGVTVPHILASGSP